MGLGHRLADDLHLEVQDARSFSYADASFDRVFSISVLEHIPDGGDSQAMREIARVLRPGGIVTISVPFDATGYAEEYLQGAVYERQSIGSRTFYQRRYDLASLHARLIAPSGLSLLETTFFGEPGSDSSRTGTRSRCAGKCRCSGHSRSWPGSL
jgi:SAM-dependent methyltransferase